MPLGAHHEHVGPNLPRRPNERHARRFMESGFIDQHPDVGVLLDTRGLGDGHDVSPEGGDPLEGLLGVVRDAGEAFDFVIELRRFARKGSHLHHGTEPGTFSLRFGG